MMRVELMTPSLPRKCSTTELHRLIFLLVISTNLQIIFLDLNTECISMFFRPFPTVNLSLVFGCNYFCSLPAVSQSTSVFAFERKTGLEPATYSLEGCRSTK